MLNFIYNTPTKIFFGKDTHKDIGRIIEEYGFHTIMMQYGKESIKKSGLYDEIMHALNEHGIDVVEMGNVEPNPKVSFVRKAVSVAKEKGVEMILAVGGGSVIDSSKATAVGAACDRDIWEFSTHQREPEKALPVGCILTLSAAGSEMSASAVLTNMENNMKRGYNSEFNRPLFSILNPELTYSVSPYQTACGIVDMMTHTMERYFIVCPPTDLTDRISESILKSIIDAGQAVMENPKDYDARATLMWASSLSHNGLTGCGRQNALCVHQLEHALSGEFDDVAHGAGLAVLYPAWAKYIYRENPTRFAQFARRVFEIKEEDDEKAALLGIEAMESFFKTIGMPQRIREFGIKKDVLPRLAELCTFHRTRTVASYKTLDYDAILEIFEKSY